jgi:hypothetical protein
MVTRSGRYHILFLVVTAGLCLFLAGWYSASAQNKGRSWSASNLSAVFREKIAGAGGAAGGGEVKAESGSILEIAGEFGLLKEDSPSVSLPNIYLTGWSTEAGLTVSRRCELLAIGIKGNDGNCYYNFPHTIVQQFSTRLADPTGNGYELKKGKEDAPVVVALLKNPARLCLAFGVPVKTARDFKLYFDGSEYSIAVVAAK